MASRGRESADEQTFDSTVDRVVRSSSVPVMVVHERTGEVTSRSISRIVVPLDGSVRAEQTVFAVNEALDLQPMTNASRERGTR